MHHLQVVCIRICMSESHILHCQHSCHTYGTCVHAAQLWHPDCIRESGQRAYHVMCIKQCIHMGGYVHVFLKCRSAAPNGCISISNALQYAMLLMCCVPPGVLLRTKRIRWKSQVLCTRGRNAGRASVGDVLSAGQQCNGLPTQWMIAGLLAMCVHVMCSVVQLQ
jgi:hypothetical protein